MVYTRLMSHVVPVGGENASGTLSDADAGSSRSVQIDKTQVDTVAISDGAKSAVNLLHLPTEIVEKILSYVPYRTTCRLRSVSRKMDEICSGYLNVSFHRLQSAMLLRYQSLKGQMPRRESSRRNHPLACEAEIIETLHMRLTLLQMTFGKHIERKNICFFAGDILDEVYRILHYITSTPNLARPYKVTDELFDLSTMAMEYFKERLEPTLPEISCFSSDFLDFANPFSRGKPMLASSNGFGIDNSPVLESYKSNRLLPPPRSTMVLRKRIRRIKLGMKKYNNQLSILSRDFRASKAKSLEQQKLLADISTRLDNNEKKNEETSRKFSSLLQELNKCKTELQYWRFKAPAIALSCGSCGRPLPPVPIEDLANHPLPWLEVGEEEMPEANVVNVIPPAAADNENLESNSTVRKVEASASSKHVCCSVPAAEVLDESSKAGGSKSEASNDTKPGSLKEHGGNDVKVVASALKRKSDMSMDCHDSNEKKPKRILKSRKK